MVLDEKTYEWEDQNWKAFQILHLSVYDKLYFY